MPGKKTSVKPVKKISKQSVQNVFKESWEGVVTFFKLHWKGTIVILLATIIFFWPLITRIGTYSEGGDAMFNAWTLARDQHCILRQGCPNYSNGNIFYPNKDSMLYSETQLSASVVTLPLHFIDQNPIFANNVLTIVSFFLSGWFLYLLAKFLSKGHEVVSITAGLVYEFAPFRMASIFHLQNLCIFGLPLAFLLILKYIKRPQRKYLVGLLFILLYVFFASWYQMVFVFAALSLLLAGLLFFRLVDWRKAAIVGIVVILAVLPTLPLARDYIKFSKASGVSFSINQETLYSSSLIDYFTPHSGTIAGKIYHRLEPHGVFNAYNLDSYSYHGVTLYIIAALVLFMAWRNRKKGKEWLENYKLLIILASLGLVGFVLSLGPLLKIKGSYTYGHSSSGLTAVVPLPYLLINKFLPQLKFIRAVGRWSVFFLFALCCFLAFLPRYLSEEKWAARWHKLIYGVIIILIGVELMPIHFIPMSTHSYSYNLKIPAVYKYISAHPEINDIVVMRYDQDYPGAPIPIAQAEDVLWSGYHNRDIFNGYSGYTPPDYWAEYIKIKAFSPDSITLMHRLNLKYIIVDKQLSTSGPQLITNVKRLIPDKVYEDQRYALFKVQ